LLLSIREPRTLVIEIIFPIVLIVAGLALATVKIFFDGSPRIMSPSIFPEPSHLIYNVNPPLGGDYTAFINNYFLNNQNEFEVD
jgi:hypothetical protein